MHYVLIQNHDNSFATDNGVYSIFQKVNRSQVCFLDIIWEITHKTTQTQAKALNLYNYNHFAYYLT